jgi:hypothetical protein
MIVIDKWSGLATNASPYTIPPGATVVQVNLQCLVPGKVSVRPGTTAVTFAAHTGGSSPIRRMFRYPRSTDRIIYQSSDGVVRVATTPS